MNIQNESSVSRAPITPRRSRLAPLIPASVVAATLGLIGWSAWPTLRPVHTVEVTQAVFDRAHHEPQAAITTVANQQAARVTVQAPGWLEAEPFYVACTALADGVVESIDVLEGEFVEAGDVVAQLVDDDSRLRLQRAEAEHLAATAAVQVAEARHHAASRTWEAPVDRERAVETASGRVAEIRAEIAQLPALIDAARATLVRLREELEWTEKYRANDTATELEYIAARQHVLAQEATVRSLEARSPILAGRLQQAQADLRAAERHLELRIEERLELDAAAAEVASRQAEALRAAAMRDEAVLELERMVVRAPISGFVQRRLKVPGDKVIRGMDSMHSAHLVHLYDPAHIQVRVDVPLADASNIFVGQACEVVVEILPDEQFTGEVLRITHEADLQKNTLQVKVRVLDPSPLLRPEMLTRVRFLPAAGDESHSGRGSTSSTTAARVLVPSGVIDESAGATRIWVVRDRRGDQGVSRPLPVEVLSEEDGWVVVSGALQPGELLIRNPTALSDGSRVRMTMLDAGGAS